MKRRLKKLSKCVVVLLLFWWWFLIFAAAADGFHLILSSSNLMQTRKRMLPYLFVRGDGVILISPPLRT